MTKVSVSVSKDGVAFQTDGDFKAHMEGAAGGGGSGKSGEMRTVVTVSEDEVELRAADGTWSK